ncbi:DUF2185 domain-containing protein [Prevotella sp. HUN102]|uniref:DUF2185 domain-containing protein n=1 Tax=Prevotella sp. HUN102 TaxID=1392486 RepID=UPI00068D02DB|nr:DUF2185 domain-containing protein [Prevotella sp. HUN102]
MAQKKFKLKPEDIKDLLPDWEEADGCFATDRITVDGCKVGYMYREEPDEDVPDSGWRFFEGEEDDEYLDNPDNMEIYNLNTIANYDMEIIPLLNAPYGTAYYRDESGVFQEEDLEIPEDE